MMNDDFKIGSWVNLNHKKSPTKIAGRIMGIDQTEYSGFTIKIEGIGWLTLNDWIVNIFINHPYAIPEKEGQDGNA